VTPTPLAPDPKSVVRCARELAKATTAFVVTDLTTLERCAHQAFRCIQGRPAGPERSACLEGAGRRCVAKITKLASARTRFAATYDGRCGGNPPRVPLPVMRDPDVLAFAQLEPTCIAEIGLSLTSHGAISACIHLAGACEVEIGLGTAMPRLTDALGLLFPLAGTPYCLPAALGDDGGLADPAAARTATRCQRTLLTAGRQLLKRQLGVAGRCVEKLLKCRLNDPASGCVREAAGCADRLDALADPSRGVRAKLGAKTARACELLDVAALGAANGLGFDAAAARCGALGEPPPGDAAAIAGCVARAYGCAASAIIRHALPLVDDELGRVGLALDDDVFCAPSAL
jgi:hypothetical protein